MSNNVSKVFDDLNEELNLGLDLSSNDNLVELESVGSCIDTKLGMIYPMYVDGTHDEEMGNHLEDVDEEWFDSLSVEDKVIVDKVLETI